MRYSIEPRYRIYVKGYRFLSFAKNIGTHLSNKYSRKFDSKRAIQKTAEATGDLIGNKIADKITSVSKKTQNNEPEAGRVSPKDVPKKRCISPEERQQIIDELRLV